MKYFVFLFCIMFAAVAFASGAGKKIPGKALNVGGVAGQFIRVPPTPTATPVPCDELTNCNDICESDKVLQPRHCFKGVCQLDTPIDCSATGQTCKETTPDASCS